MSSETLHEDPGKLGPEVINHHRAIVSLMEEFEAVDWYDQRAKATDDAQLRAIMEHNRDEEKEHAMMVLEWLRRNDPKLNEHMKTYLFTTQPITEVEKEATQGGGSESAGEATAGDTMSDGSLGIGSLRQVTK